MSYFDDAIQVVLAHEGGYVNNPRDPGGETKFGICRRVYPDLDIKNLTREMAVEIYRRDYWPAIYSQVNDRQVVTKIFDMTVNMGAFQSHRILQRALDIPDDGKFGPQTLKAVNAADPADLLAKIVGQQKKFYRHLADAKPAMKEFLPGWLHRAEWPPEIGRAVV